MKEIKEKQFNEMLEALRCIAGYRKSPTTFMSPEQIRKSKDAKFLGFEDVMVMAYENIQAYASGTIKGIKPIIPINASIPNTEPK